MTKAEVKKLTEQLENVRGIRDYLSKQITELKDTNNQLQHENYKLQVRLDACLYSMVLMQDIIKKSTEDKVKGNHLSLAT
jgi:regulator of replication initiation timing